MAGWIRSYERRWVRGDLIAGVAVAALIVPKNLGYAGIAGIPLQNGLYAAAAGAILYAIFGTSRQISTGPSSGLAAVAASAVAVAGVKGIQDAASFVAMITLVSGLLFLLLAVLKMGWIAQFLSRAVVTGFLFGAAIDVVIGELPKLTGTKVTGSNPIQELWSWIGTLGDASLATVAVGAVALAVVFGVRIITPRIPGALVLVVGGLVASWLFDLGAHGVALVGEVPRGLPPCRSPTPRCCGITRARLPSLRWRSSSSGSRKPPATPGPSPPGTATASTSTRNRPPRAWRTPAPACSRECRSRRACPRAH